MRFALGLILTMIGSVAIAATNPKWSFEVEDASIGNDQGVYWTLESKHPDKDITLVMKLTAFHGEAGNANGWSIETTFGPKINPPTESNLKQFRIMVNGENIELPQKLSRRSVISSGLPVDVMEAIREKLRRGFDWSDGQKWLLISYLVPNPNYRKGKSVPKGSYATARFLMADWTRAYRLLVADAKTKGAAALVISNKEINRTPISRLPTGVKKPSREDMQNLASQAGVELEAAYEMSFNQLVAAIEAAKRARTP